jgi:hypothetical protein
MVDTELGGAFYLLNLALFLELYGDFTTPLSPGIALDPWDLLALLVPALLGERPPDPLWRLLADLAGRPPGRPPGAAFRPPRAWRTPPAWLAPFPPDGEWTWSAGPATLRLRHPAGFLAAAVPRTAAPARAQLARELRRVGRPPVRRAALGPEPRDPRTRWVSRLAAYAGARLRLALDLDAAAAFLVRRHARVHVTPAHVDVVFSLADHAIDIRYAGLDRTPGWIPAAGRFVELHFR